MLFLLLLLLAYIIGSVNMALWVSRWADAPDPRDAYSRNPGATNVYRHAGPWWGLLVVMLEAVKAAAVAWIAFRLLPNALVPWVGVALILGNRFPLFHGFRGGKGVANYLGFALALNYMAAIVGIGFWASGIYFTKQPFIGSFLLVTVLTAGMVNALGTSITVLSGAVFNLALIFGLHHENIRGFLSPFQKTK
jgi:glycerol-3-phosphate acyltransferase PlsY